MQRYKDMATPTQSPCTCTSNHTHSTESSRSSSGQFRDILQREKIPLSISLNFIKYSLKPILLEHFFPNCPSATWSFSSCASVSVSGSAFVSVSMESTMESMEPHVASITCNQQSGNKCRVTWFGFKFRCGCRFGMLNATQEKQKPGNYARTLVSKRKFRLPSFSRPS